MNMRIVPFVILFCLLSACASTRHSLLKGQTYMAQGKILSLKDGSEISLEIENYACNKEGKVLIASNPKTGENFKGNYLINRESNDSTSVVSNVYGFKTGKVETSSSVKYILTGFLRGDKGTVLSITVNTGPQQLCLKSDGNFDMLQFYGEATDNTGNKYQIYMSGDVELRQINNLP